MEIELDPKNALAYVNRGNAESELKQYHAAIKDYDNAIKLDPKYAVAYTFRGTTKAELQAIRCGNAGLRQSD